MTTSSPNLRVRDAVDAIAGATDLDDLRRLRRRLAPLLGELWRAWRQARSDFMAVNLAYHKREREIRRDGGGV